MRNSSERETNWAVMRRRMVAEQIVMRGVTDQRVLDAMREVPRHKFVPSDVEEKGYDDTPLPIRAGQTISQPYIVALMTEVLKIKEDNVVLEVGTGSGYQAAVLAHLALRVFSVERVPELASDARERFKKLGVTNVEVHEGDGSLGLPDKAPFDAILVAAASPITCEPLLEQLAADGRLILPIGSRNQQQLQLWTTMTGKRRRSLLAQVRFVPLVGKWGWEA